MNPVIDVKSEADFQQAIKNAKKELVVVHFWAPWATQCEQMNLAMEELAKQFVRVHLIRLEAEEIPEVSQHFEIVAVPTFIFIKNGQKIDRLDGAHVPELEKMIKKNLDAIAPITDSIQTSKEMLDNKLKRLINSAPCILFMKGSPETPRCGFSKQTIALLQKYNAEFSTFDILEAPDVRQGLKEYSNWPTYPQLYINGKLIGGLDILKEMDEEDELDEMLPKPTTKESLEDRLKKLINQDKIMLFMKGEPDAPRCGFSKKIVEILKEIGTKFGHFDILTDDEVRQGLKTFSKWPTYPQIYVKGELLGGLDIIRDMQEDGELEDALKTD
uniref:glutaredoxin-3-like n=1 Tax=Styela clava TaxID=7725 RepID=UPI00193A593A|nr:glutaredoxin-3-like [Styela clava]